MFVRVLVLLLATVLAVAVAARRSSGAAHQQTYVVRPGDTLWSIATAHYAGDPREGVWKIEGENGLHSATIQAGERLVIPSA
jgi:LysM repeat protein